MNIPPPLRVLLAAAGAVADVTHGQTVTLRVLIPNSSDVRAVSLPSLHDGMYAGFGSRTSDARSVVYGGRLGDPPGTPPTVIAATGEVIPNRSDRAFAFLRIPTVWNGVAYFTGGAGTTLSDGTYARGLNGGPLEIVSDRFNGLGPWIEGPFAGPHGLAYVNQGASAGTGAGISCYTYDRRYIPVAQYFGPTPDGALYQSTDNSYVAAGGSKVAFSIRCTYLDSGAGQGTYVHDLETGRTTMIVNWTTPIPGDGRLVTVTSSLDTDGRQIVFAVGNGNPYFGGIAAICRADTDGTHLRVIARNGDPVPGLPGKTFRNVGRCGIDAGVIYFQGTYVDGVNERTSLFAHANGTTIPVILFTQQVGGVTGLTPWFDPRGMDGPDAVVLCEYVTPDNPFLQKYMLVHARVDLPCPADFNQDGGVDGGDLEAFFVAWQDADPRADVNEDGGVDGADVESFFRAWEAGGC